jgi:hypothetical protein
VIDCSITWRARYLPITALSLTRAWMKPLQVPWPSDTRLAMPVSQGSFWSRQSVSARA